MRMFEKNTKIRILSIIYCSVHKPRQSPVWQCLLWRYRGSLQNKQGSGQNKQGGGQIQALTREILLAHYSMYLHISIWERLLCEVHECNTQFALALLLNNIFMNFDKRVKSKFNLAPSSPTSELPLLTIFGDEKFWTDASDLYILWDVHLLLPSVA